MKKTLNKPKTNQNDTTVSGNQTRQDINNMSESYDIGNMLLTEDVLVKAESSNISTRESTIGLKTVQDGEISICDENKKRLDEEPGEHSELGGTISRSKMGVNHYKGVLGEFDYDTSKWAIGTKEVTNESGEKGTIPVLRYIEEDNDKLFEKSLNGDKIHIPDGVKSLDYTFEGLTQLETVPDIPDSVESAHCAFKDCTGLQRASKSAKEGEKSTGKAKAISAITATSGVAIALAPIPGVGLPLLVAAGGAAAYHGSKKLDGRGGDWIMSDTLKDASSMFQGCKNLEEGYEKAGKNLINARDMYHGAKNLGNNTISNLVGANGSTDFTNSKLSKEAVQGSFTDTNKSVADKVKDNYSSDWDEASGTLNKTDISEQEKKEVEDLSSHLNRRDVADGHLESQIAKESGGTVESLSGGSNSKASGLQKGARLLDYGATSFAEFKILKLVVKNPLIALAGTVGLQAVGVLPKSMKPVISGVANFVGTDNPVGKTLNTLADKLPDADTPVFASDEDMKNNSVTGNTKDALKIATSDKTMDVTKAMRSNGTQVAKDGVLLSVIDHPEKTDLKQLSNQGYITAAALEEHAKALSDEKGQLDANAKDQLANMYRNTMNGFQAYEQAATMQIESMYGAGSPNCEKAKMGLKSVMQEMAGPALASAKELDQIYQFLPEEQKEQYRVLTYDETMNQSTNRIDSDEIYANAYQSETKVLDDVQSNQKEKVKQVTESQLDKETKQQAVRESRKAKINAEMSDMSESLLMDQQYE